MNCFVRDPESPFAFSEYVLKPMPSAKTPELQTQESLHTQPPDYCLTAVRLLSTSPFCSVYMAQKKCLEEQDLAWDLSLGILKNQYLTGQKTLTKVPKTTRIKCH